MPRRAFTLLFDHHDYSALAEQRPDALDADVMAFDPDLHLTLTESSSAHLTPWDVVSYSDGPMLRRFEADVLGFWSRHAIVAHRGYNLLELAAYRHVACLSRLSWAAFVIRRAFERLCPSEVIIANRGGGHGLDRPAAEPGMPLLFGLLRGMAEAAGLPVHALHRPPTPPRVAPSAARPPASDAPCRVIPAGCILLHANGPDLLRQAPLIRALKRDGAFVVQLHGVADAATLALLSTIGHTLLHERDAVGAPNPPARLPGLREAYRRFRECCHAAPAALRCIYTNDGIDSHFQFIFDEYARRLAWQVDAWTRFFAMHRPAAVVANYHAPLLDVAVRLNIPTLVLPHGLMLAGDTRWFSSLPAGCTLGAISPAHRDTLVASGVPSHRIAVTGDPAGDDLIQFEQAGTISRAAEWPHAPHARPPAPMPFRVLLITSNLGSPSKGSRLPITDWAAAMRQGDELAALIRSRPDWTFLVRGHPRYDHSALRSKLTRADAAAPAAIDLTDIPLPDALAQADAVVVLNVITSALMEASLRPRPVILLAAAMPWYEPQSWLTGGWPHVASVAELEALLVAMRADPLRRDALIRQTQAAARQFFGGRPAPAAPRVLSWLRARVSLLSPPENPGRAAADSLCR